MKTVNRIAGVVLGILLVLLGLFAVVETFAVTFWNRSWPLPVQQWRRDLATTQWSDGRVLLVAGQARKWRLGVSATATADSVSSDQVKEAIRSQLVDLGAASDVPVHVTLRRARSRT